VIKVLQVCGSSRFCSKFVTSSSNFTVVMHCSTVIITVFEWALIAVAVLSLSPEIKILYALISTVSV
jgi:hypothetical protein